MGIQITASSYADFKAAVLTFQEKGQVVYGPPIGSGEFNLAFVGEKFDFLVLCSASGGEPATLTTDFPNAIIGTSAVANPMYAAGF